MAARLTEGVTRLLSEISEQIGREVVPATPVDTGAARANWRPALNAQPIVPVTRTDPTGAATVARIATVARQMRAGDTFYLSNNLPYITALNAGSSPQAPANFVQDAVATAVRTVTRRKTGGLT